ncbi:glycosyltransferase family protein [Azospirillum agricola]|uniref:colanic acid biosynthesis glycosyl transferase n=1 Tax=Azospirillum agricola TaxID=1720247 RepID=UPI000A0F0B8F|nr:colanic acid biosynthesis glycosyl transferase [Azospirillum agricola]SMH58747.1 putative colanic acid biosynthesis glycosyltransferase [Azospirillum lipoferum]
MTPPDGSFAVLTVARDDLAGLMATRDSLRAQSWQGFAWIIADGGSADGTADWLRAHAGEMAWWRSAPDSGPHGGPYGGMNRALDAARALGCRHALFLNAGDRLAGADTAALLRDAIGRHGDAALLYGDALERLGDGRILSKPARSHRRAALGMFTHHQAMIYRLDTPGSPRFDERFAIAADYAFTLAALERGAAVRLPVPVCVFAPGGLSQRNAAQGRREQSLIRRDMLGHGRAHESLLRGAQWAIMTLRRLFPKAYATWRFRQPATLFLS